jgi:hypothetical protein
MEEQEHLKMPKEHLFISEVAVGIQDRVPQLLQVKYHTDIIANEIYHSIY